jgi:hypothetical protein
VSRRPARALVAALGAVAALGSCGLPDDRVPRIIAADETPLDLSEAPGSPGTTAPEGDDEVRLFFVREQALTPTTRSADDDDLETAITLLLAGPTEDERTLSSSIPSETELNAASVDGGTAVLDLGCVGDVPADQCGVLAVGAVDQLTIFAQLTCTAMDVPGIEGVRFLQEGQPQDAPTDSGTIQSPSPVTCDDYRSLQG